MKNIELFERVIKKAMDNGWMEGFYVDKNAKTFRGGVVFMNKEKQVSIDLNLLEVIFNHEFAKYFFGFYPQKSISINVWKYHLQQMIIEEEPLKYLEKFL